VEGLVPGGSKADGTRLERTLEGGDELKSMAEEGRGSGGGGSEGTGIRLALPGEAV